MDNSVLFLISVVSAMLIGYIAVKKNWKIIDIF